LNEEVIEAVYHLLSKGIWLTICVITRDIYELSWASFPYRQILHLTFTSSGYQKVFV